MEKIEILRKFDNDKLIDVVRNYKRYGYDEELRNNVIDLLCTRGWTKEELEISGYLTNPQYDEAVKQYKAYCRNSLIGIGVLVFSVGILLLVYLFFVFLAYRNVTKFSKALGRDKENALLVSSIGVIAYFYLKEKMKEELKGMR